MKQLTLTALAALATVSAHAAEGMWTLDNLPLSDIQARFGAAPSRALLDQMIQSSLQVDGGCSGSFVSAEGLALTNHHCVVGCVTNLSTPKSDLVRNGFLAKDRASERQCPAFELSNLESITDVTAQVQGALAGKTGAEAAAAFAATSAHLTDACRAGAGDEVRCDLVTLYSGGRYALHRFHRYTDVRLVWAPEDAIAAFGGDPDNFMFPRYNLDAGLLRAYEHGKPAVIKTHLRFQPAGPQPDAPLYVIGNPGHTDRAMTLAQLEYTRDHLALRRLPDSYEYRGMLGEYGTRSSEARRTADEPLRWTENGIKVMRGQVGALMDAGVMQTKAKAEAELRAYYQTHQPADHATYGDPWEAIAKAQMVRREIGQQAAFVDGSRGGLRSNYLGTARLLVRGAIERDKPNDQRLPEFSDNAMADLRAQLASTAPITPALEQATLAWSLGKMRDVLGPDDPYVKQIIGGETPEQIARRMVGATKLGTPAERLRLWQGGRAAIEASKDPFIVLARQLEAPGRALSERMRNEVSTVERLQATRIAKLRFARDGDKTYPDATGTLRLSWGELQGWTEGGKTIPSGTTFAGLYPRVTGAAPFALPANWLAAKARLPMGQRFNFSATTDIIGGNSGSPVINAQGELVGLAFDGNIHSTGGSYVYDPLLNRTVSVDAGAILEALRTVYRADHLVQELR